MLRQDNVQKWEVEPFKPHGEVRGVKRKVLPIPKFGTPVAVKVKINPKKAFEGWNRKNLMILMKMRAEGCTWKQIADKLGTTEGAARKRWKRCLEERR